MPAVPPIPCPIRLGTIKSDGPPALLHTYTLERNIRKLEKLLKKRVDVDCENDLGQTPLFCASLLGLTNVVELLLQYGADPNHRCVDRSTPVHAAVFSCNPWLLSGLLDAGGDLRLHDEQGRTPRDWAEAGAQEHSPRMLDFLKSCVSHMCSLTQTRSPRDGRVTPTSSKTLLRSPSLLELLRPGGSDLLVNKKLSIKSSVCDVVQCFGFGKLCVGKSQQPAGLLASVPLVADSELAQAEDEALYSFSCGASCCLTNFSWRGCRVTVKELQKHAEEDLYQDLLITELEHCSRLFHPHLLQLMAVSISADLQRSRLVYERVHVGSLHTVLYHRRAEFPVLQVCDLLSVVLQVCEALLYLHGRALVLRALSSHSVIIVHPGVAKVTGLGFMVTSEGSCPGKVSFLPLPAGLYNWAAPEVIRRRACTGKADLYSLCTLIQELYTDAVPWGCVDPRWIKQAVDAGQALTADPAVPQPYYQLLQSGLQPRAKNRTCSLLDVRYTLRCDLKELSGRRDRSGGRPLSAGQSMHRWSAELLDGKPEEPGQQPPECSESDSTVDREIQDQLRNLDRLLENETSQTSPRRLQNDEAESSTDAEELHQEISYRDILPLDEWRMSLCSPVDKTSSSLDVWSSSSAVEENLATRPPDAVSEHISAIVLNLKVSQVLLQQVESSLEKAELGLTDRPQYNELDAGVSEDEVDGLGRKSEGKVVVLKAVGPPSTYRPLLELQGGQLEWGTDGDEEVSHYCSAGEDSLPSPQVPTLHHCAAQSTGDRNVSQRDRRADQRQQPVRITEQSDRSDGSSHEARQMTAPLTADHGKPKWTSEVSELVVRMTRGRLGPSAGPVGSSDSEEVEEQQRPLVDKQNPHNHTLLEQLSKSFAGVRSESEESADFHTFTMLSTQGESVSVRSVCFQEESSSESDCVESPVEPSSIFYTPKHHPDSVDTAEQLSQTLSSEEDLDVTMEICRPSTAVTDGQASFRVSPEPVPEEPDRTGPESSTSVKGALQSTSQVADIADLSSITCSPAQLQEWAGQDGAPPSPHSMRFPPCNSTPRSPGPDHSPAPRSRESVPPLQSLLDTSPWDSAPDRSICTEAYATASLGASDTMDPSQSSVLQTPRVLDVPLEDLETPTTSTQEFTTASCGTKHTPAENRSQTHGSVGVEVACEEEEEADEERNSRVSEHSAALSSDRSLDQPSGSAAPSVLGKEGRGVLEEEEEEEECEEQADAEQQQELFEKELSEEEEEKAPEKVLDGNDGGQTAVRGRSSDPPGSLEDTDRAHSTLDEVLQRLLVERMENQGAPKDPEATSEEMTTVCDVQVREECVCPAGDRSEGAACKGVEESEGVSSDLVKQQGEKSETGGPAVWNQLHRVIVLEHTPVKTQSELNQNLSVTRP
ncbi:hypothetical protein MHYP_G00182710 [Metynnis hypsauchen]